MDFQQATLTICTAAAVAFVWYKWYHTCAISDIPGPKNPSWTYGHMWWWQREEAGVVEKRLLEEYGAMVRWNGFLGEQRLWIVDPKAIHHILQVSPHLYEKTLFAKELSEALMDRGLPAVDGDEHKRHRRAMAPAFGLIESKALYPYFACCSNTLADKWHGLIFNEESGQTAIVDVHSWLSKAALDAIGAGAFDYDFGALGNTDNKLTKSYTNLGFGASAWPSKGRLFAIDFASKFAPKGLIGWAMERNQRPGIARLRENRTYVHEVAAKLIEDKKEELKNGTPKKDVLSTLVKANSALRPDWRLTNEEVVAQVRTIIFAGHETTGKTLAFALWELAKNRRIQESLRAEVMDMLGRIRVRGGSDFTVDDFDSMPYLLAFEKEILRVHPIVIDLRRVAMKDDFLPLAKPVVGVSGKVYDELPVPAGTVTTISLMGYNLNKDIWGPDAYEFRPERWLEAREKLEFPLGVYGNLATFSGGPRGCIGWRFGVIEMHAFLVTLIKQFDFSFPENAQAQRRMRGGVLSPVVAGEERKGPQLPLKVTALRNE